MKTLIVALWRNALQRLNCRPVTDLRPALVDALIRFDWIFRSVVVAPFYRLQSTLVARPPSATRRLPPRLKADARCAKPVAPQSPRLRRDCCRKPEFLLERQETAGTSRALRSPIWPGYPPVRRDAGHRPPDASLQLRHPRPHQHRPTVAPAGHRSAILPINASTK